MFCHRHHRCAVKQPCASSSVRRWPRRLAMTTVAVLVWLQLLVAAEPQQPHIGLPNCPTICGNVSVPYPFGFQPGCYLEGFNLTCYVYDASTPPQLLFVGKQQQFTIGEISHVDSTMRTVDALGLIITRPNPSSGAGSILFQGQRQWDWKVMSRALQAPNESRSGNATCPQDLGATACHSSHSTCQVALVPTSNIMPFFHYNIPGYTCRCDEGYQGNAYLSDGCQDIDECTLPQNSCFGNCTNLPGTYLCQCPEGTIGNPHAENGCVKPHNLDTGLIIGLGIGSGAMLLFLVIGTTILIRTIKARRKKKMKERYSSSKIVGSCYNNWYVRGQT